jgi:heme/copper-type cytochrome/quinol oxidase subunit 3
MADVSIERRPLPVGIIGSHSSGWWGMVGLILTEAALFVYLLFSYYYFAIQPHAEAWPPEMPGLKLSGPNTVILLLSSAAVWWGERGTRQGRRSSQLVGLGIGLLLGIIFIIVQAFEWKSKSFSLTSGPYGSLFFTVTGFHMAHVILGVLILAAVQLWSALGYFGPVRSAPVTIGAMYWHFVDAVWLAVFFTFYITPYLG